MRFYKSLASITGTVVYGPYSPSPLRKGVEFLRGSLKALENSIRSKSYASIVFMGSAVFFAFAFFAFLFSLPPRSDAAWGGVPPAPAAATVSPTVRTQELHIANNGAILLRNARVVSINGTTIAVSTAWGSAQFNWTVHTNASTYETHQFGTRFLDNKGNSISLENIRTGDFVTITGMLDSSAGQPTLDADSVRRLQ